MRDSVRLGRIGGFPVGLNWSVLVVVLLFAWSLAEAVLPQTAPGHTTGAYWAAGVVGSLLLMASLLAHELAHAIVARRHGVEVQDLTLWMFGGVATLRGEPPDAASDLRIAAVGPGTSLALAAGFGVLDVALDALGAGGLVLGVLAWLSGINLLLAIFNLVPGAPLDGGRILRALLWMRSGDRDLAAATATRAGQGVGYVLVGLGLVMFMSIDAVGGLWTILVGWFLLGAARAEEEATVAAHVLRGVTAADVMSTDLETGYAAASVADFIGTHVLLGRHSAYPVLDAHGAVTGLVTLAQLRAVAPAERATTLVVDVCLPVAHVATCAPSELVVTLLPRLTPESGRRALVFDQGRLVGLVTPTDVNHALEARALLTGSGRP